MNHYFFDTTDGKGFHLDEFGDEFDDLEEARVQAQSLLHEIARAEMPDRDFRIITCDVRDDADHIVYRSKLTFEGRYDSV